MLKIKIDWKMKMGFAISINGQLWNEKVLSFNQDGIVYILHFLHLND